MNGSPEPNPGTWWVWGVTLGFPDSDLLEWSLEMLGFRGGSDGKESACSTEDTGSIP